MRLFPLLALPVWMVACSGGGDGKETGDTSGGDDTGDTGDTGTPNYDPGCITVDGGGGYAHLADALSVATDGSVIALCDGTYEESVTVTKAVTIQGASEAGTIVVGQGVDPALRIESVGATVSTLTVTGSYSGIVVSGGSGTSITSVTFDQPEYWGLQLQNADAVSVSGCTIVEPGAGGVEVSGGSAEISASTLTDIPSYGFQIGDGADVTLIGNTVDGVSMLSEDVTDGYAVNVVDASLTTSGNTFTNLEGMGIAGDAATLSIGDDTISEIGYLGLYIFDGTLETNGLTVQGAYLQGAYLAVPAVTMVDTTITVDPLATGEFTYAQWNNADKGTGPWFGAVLVAADDMVITGLTVSGYNDYGALLVPYSSRATATIAIDGLSVDDTARRGLWIEAADVTGGGVSVTNLREPEYVTPCTSDGSSYSVDVSTAVFTNGADLDLDGVVLKDNAGWGLSSYQNSTTFTNAVIEGNACAGIINFAGVLTVSDSSFSRPAAIGSIWDYQGTSVLTGNTFHDSHMGATQVYDLGDGNTYTYIYSGGQGVDINANTSNLTVVGNTFVEGDTSLSLFATEAEVTDNTWTGYDGMLLYSYQPPSGTATVFDRNEITDQGNYVVMSGYGRVLANDVTVSGMRSASYSYEAYYNDKLQYTGTSSTAPSPFYAYSSSGYDGALELSNVTVEGAEWGLGQTYDAELVLTDVSVEGVAAAGSGYTVLQASWSAVQPVATIDGLTVGDAGAGGLYFSTSNPDASYVTLSNLDFASVAGTSLTFSGFDAVTLQDSDLGTPGGYGLYLYGRGAVAFSEVSNVSVDAAASYGVYAGYGNVNFSGVEATSSGASGMYLYTGTASVTGSSLTGNAQYGMQCSGVTINDCSGNDLSGNGYGEQSNCSTACESGGGDTGGGDTGAPPDTGM